MASTVHQREAEFTEAADTWNLERLYTDLAVAKGKSLTPVERKFLRGLLCGYSPAEIADTVYKSRNSSSVRVYLSNGLYKYIQELLTRQSGDTVKIHNWSRVANLLEKAGYKKSLTNLPLEPTLPETSDLPAVTLFQDWEELMDVEALFGRQEELTQLSQWLLQDNCRLVGLLGMSGVGKTALATKLAEQVQQSFDLIIWRSLRHVPPISKLLTNLIQLLSQKPGMGGSTSVNEKISQLMTYLRTRRCLLILDQAEAVLQSGSYAGYCTPGYEGYGELWRRLGEERHVSCVVITSREKPKEIALLEGKNLPVRSCLLKGLPTSAGQDLLYVKGLVASKEDLSSLIKCYGGNPLALKLVATTIQDVFGGEVGAFLEQSLLIFGNLRDVLDQQFNRLSNLERNVIYSLVIHHKLRPLQSWSEAVLPGVSRQEQIEAFESLHRRSLLEKNSAGFILQPMIRAYLSEKLVEQVCEEMTTKEVAQLVSQTIIHPPMVELEIGREVV